MGEVIELSVRDPVETESLSGLDSLITKLERVDVLMEKLGGGGARTLRLGLEVEGAEKLDSLTTSAQTLTGALRAVGDSNWSAKLDASAVTSEAALESIAAEARAANAALAEGIRELGVMEGRFARMGEGGGFSDRMARARSVIESTRADVVRLQEAAAVANRVEGAATGGFSGGGARVGEAVATKVRLAEETQALAEADRAGALAALESGGALERQREIAAGKIGVMESLTSVTENLAAADERAAVAAVKAAEAEREAAATHKLAADDWLSMGSGARGQATERGNGLMNEKTAVDAEGRTSRMHTYQMGPGQTFTTKERASLTETDYIQKFRTEFEKLDAEFAARKGAVAGQGSLPGSAPQIAVLDAEAEARRRLVAAMNAEGLGDDSLALRQTIKANQTETQARVAEIRLANSERVTEAERMETEALRENIAAMDRAVAMERGLAISEEGRITILQRQAQAYRELAQSVREAGTNQPGRAGLIRTTERKAAGLDNEAARAETEMRDRRRNAEGESERLMQEYENSALTEKRRTTRQGPTGTDTTLVGERAGNGIKETVTLVQKLSAEGEVLSTTLQRVESSAAAAGSGVASADRSLFSNVATISAWAAGAGVLYGTLGLIKDGFTGLLDAQENTARLENVFKRAAGGAVTMRDDLLALAAANGRSGDEAIKTGTAWERMGYSQREVLAGTNLALQQANISESTGLEVTTALTPVMRVYGLSVEQTRGFLDGLNRTSANANVSSKDLLASVSRVAPVANTAGVSLSELTGIATVMSTRTGQAGASVGAMIRSLALGLENPTLQKFLSSGPLKLDVKTETGDLKNLSALLSELYVKFQNLDKSDQGAVISKLGGKKQGAAVEGLLDDYIESQKLAIDATRALGTTEEQNNRIRETTKVQLAALNTEWQRLFTNLGSAGGSNFGFMATLTEFVKVLGAGLGLLADYSPAVSIFIGFIAVMTARLVRSALAMSENSEKGGFLMTTLNSLRTAWTTLGEAIALTNGKMATGNRLMAETGARAGGAAGRLEGAALAKTAEGPASKGSMLKNLGGLAFGTLFSGELLIAVAGVAALEAAMWGLSKVVDHFKSDSENAADKLAAMNSELERTTALLDGADKAARLAGTLSKALPKLNERDPGRAGRAVGDFAGVAYTEEEDAGGGRRAALRDELTTLVATGRIKEAQTRLDEVQARLQRDKVTLAERSEQTQGKLLVQQQESLTLLDREIADRKAAGGDVADAEKRRADVMQAMGKARGEMGRSFATLVGDDEEDGGARPREADDDYKKGIEARQKGIDAVYAALPTSDNDSEVGKMDRELEKLDARKAMLEEQSKADADAAAAAKKAADERYAAAQKEVDQYADIRTEHGKLADEVAREQNRINTASKESRSGTGWLQRLAGFGDVADDDQKKGPLYQQERLRDFEDDHDGELGADAKAQEKLEAAKAGVDAQGQLNGAKQDEIEKNEKTLAQERESLQLQRDKYASLTDALKTGERQGKIEPEAFKIGRNEVEKMFNEAGGFAPLLEQAVARYQAGAKSGDGVEQNRGAGEALQLGARLSEIQLSLDERRYRVQAEIVNERRKENEEASKSLAFASREDQLRAALLARFEQANGKFSNAGFNFLDQGTRESVKKFTPDALPAEAGGGRGQELQREQALLGQNLAGFSVAVKATTDFLNKNIKVSTTPLPGQSVPAAPQIASPSLTFTFGEQFNALAQTLQQTVVARFDTEISSIRATLARFTPRSPINPAQSPGADASAGN